MSVKIADSAVGLSTIRNVSLLRRSLDETRQRLLERTDDGETNSLAAKIGLSRRMRDEMSSLSGAIRSLENNTRKNQAAEAAIAGLREHLMAAREVAIAATEAAADTEEAGAAYQEQVDRLVAGYNEAKAEAAHDGQRLFSGAEGSVTYIPATAGVDVSEPRRAKEAIGKIDESLRGLDRAKAAVTLKLEEEYRATVKSLEVSSQNMVAAESVLTDSDRASEHADYTRQIIQLNAGVAALAQGNLVSEAVFKLLHT